MNKHILIITLFSIQMMFANSFVARDGGVVVQVNAKESYLKVNETIKLEEGDTIWFISGNGRIIDIETQTIQISKNSTINSHRVPFSEGSTLSSWLKKKKDIFLAKFIDSTESTRVASSKSIGHYNISIYVNDQYLFIVSDQLGPLDVTLFIKDENQKIIRKLINSENDLTFFKIDKALLKDKYTIEVENGMGESVIRFATNEISSK